MPDCSLTWRVLPLAESGSPPGFLALQLPPHPSTPSPPLSSVFTSADDSLEDGSCLANYLVDIFCDILPGCRAEPTFLPVLKQLPHEYSHWSVPFPNSILSLLLPDGPQPPVPSGTPGSEFRDIVGSLCQHPCWVSYLVCQLFLPRASFVCLFLLLPWRPRSSSAYSWPLIIPVLRRLYYMGQFWP